MGLETLAIASLTAGAIGTGVSAYNQYQAGKAQQSLNNYNASVTEATADYNANQILAVADHNAALLLKTAEVNAGVSQANAQTAVSDSLAQASAMRYNNRRILASNRARVAAGGVVVGVGSPLITEVQNAGLLEMRALEAERQGRIRADQHLNESAVDRWQAGEAAKRERYQAQTAADLERFTGRQQATLDRMAGTSARRAGRIGAASTILQGASSFGQSYYGLS